MMSGDLSKLPKWARDRIEYLERENERLKKSIEDEFRGSSGTAFVRTLDRGAAGFAHIPLYEDHVMFRLGDGEITCGVQNVERGDPLLVISAGGRFSDRLDIEPRAENSVNVRVRRDDGGRCQERRACVLGFVHDGPCRNRHGERIDNYPPDSD